MMKNYANSESSKSSRQSMYPSAVSIAIQQLSKTHLKSNADLRIF